MQIKTLNHPLTVCGPNDTINLCVTDLSSYDLGKGIVDVDIPESLTFYLGFEQFAIGVDTLFRKDNYRHFMSKRIEHTKIQTSTFLTNFSS